MELFTWNGVSSDFHNLSILNISGLYDIPKKQYESIEVPGRTGNLLIDTGATLNKSITIQCCLSCSELSLVQTRVKMQEIQEWLVGPNGYQILSFPDESRFNAIVKEIGTVEQKKFNRIFVFTIIFECYEVIE